MALNVVRLLGDLPAAQQGYFTRAQAVTAGIEDFELTRSVQRGFISRLDHGIYRVTGAGYDEHQTLRVAWMRLQPASGPRDRIRTPTIWVSHESAAALHGFGIYLADSPTFIASHRVQPRKGVKVYRRSKGLKRSEYTVVDGFPVTTIERTAADLAQSKSDGGHLGRFLDEAIGVGATTLEKVASAQQLTEGEIKALVAMDAHELPT